MEASGYQRAFELLAEHADTALALLDLNLQGQDGFEVLEGCLDRYPSLPVAILSGSKNFADMQRAMEMGAAGFIPKDTSGDLMVKALSMILAGGYYIPKTLLQPTEQTSTTGGPVQVTPRQLEVTSLICDGLTNKQIGTTLGIAEATIKMHVTAIFRAMKVSNRTQLVRAAQARGLT